MFLEIYETAEKERARLYEELLEHQTVTLRDREAEHTWHMQELDKARQQFGHEMDKIIEETEARVKTMHTLYEIIMAQLQLKLEEAQHENQ